MYKNLIGVLSVLLLVNVAQAQFYKTLLPSPEFNTALEKIVRDFRYNFQNIEGASLASEGQEDIFESSVVLPGATNCIITKYHSVKDTTASWHGVMYEGDEYSEAIKIYKNTFRLLNKSKIQLIDRSTTGFSGKLEEPSEALRFTVSSLQLTLEDHRYNRFTAQVELISNITGYQVNVYFLNKKADNERE